MRIIRIPALVLVLQTAIAAGAARSEECTSGAGCKPACAAGACECVYCCRPVLTHEPVTKECFEVECEFICIPGIKWPWQDCCEPPSRGRVRKVHRLTTEEYECGQRPVWEWELTCECRRIHAKPAGSCRTGHAPPCCPPRN